MSLIHFNSNMEIRLRQMVEILSREERNLANNPAGLARAADFLESCFEGLGMNVSRQTYQVGGLDCQNIEAVAQDFVGCHAPHIILGAHYDSSPGTMGADDNCSAVAILLETASFLIKNPAARRSIRFLAYTNEEPPHFTNETMGSYVHAKSCRDANHDITAMICLESLGYFTSEPDSQEMPFHFGIPQGAEAMMNSRSIDPTIGNFLTIVSDEASAAQLHLFDSCLQSDSLMPTLPLMMPDMRMSDHFCYWDQGYPALMLSDTALFRNPNYHRASDLPDTLNYPAMVSIVERLGPALEKFVSQLPCF